GVGEIDLVLLLDERGVGPVERGRAAKFFDHDALPRRSVAPVAQRCAMGATSRRFAPVYSCRGRPIFCSGSEIISFHCAIQPTVRANANSAVNMSVGKPIALRITPE